MGSTSTILRALALGLSLTTTALAADFTVTTDDDHADGLCDIDCSLRDAVVAANALPGNEAGRHGGPQVMHRVPGTHCVAGVGSPRVSAAEGGSSSGGGTFSPG